MLSFRISIRTRKLQNLLFWTYCLNLLLELPFNSTLKPPKNITQLNTKLGFSITHIPTNFISLNPFYQKSQQQLLIMMTQQFNHQMEILQEGKKFEYKFCE